ncbi:MAG: hypothetical protein MK193_03850 [Lentisphaeria bacterium]|nr:hypothetical protein [Lentisphaeria bacterium]
MKNFLLLLIYVPISTFLIATTLLSIPHLGLDLKNIFLIWTGIGLIGGIVVFASNNFLMPFYVFAHELAHWLAAKLMRRKTSDFTVGLDSGHVKIENPNTFIALAPYLFPTYLALWFILCSILKLFWNHPQLPKVFFIGLGVCLAFHVVFTIKVMKSEQSDFDYAGKTSSLFLITAVNLIEVYFFYAALTGSLHNATKAIIASAQKVSQIIIDFF